MILSEKCSPIILNLFYGGKEITLEILFKKSVEFAGQAIIDSRQPRAFDKAVLNNPYHRQFCIREFCHSQLVLSQIVPIRFL